MNNPVTNKNKITRLVGTGEEGNTARTCTMKTDIKTASEHFSGVPLLH